MNITIFVKLNTGICNVIFARLYPGIPNAYYSKNNYMSNWRAPTDKAKAKRLVWLIPVEVTVMGRESAWVSILICTSVGGAVRNFLHQMHIKKRSCGL